MYQQILSYDIKIVVGDTNAKVGKEIVHKPTMGIESLHEESNDNGFRLINLAVANDMIIASTYFPRKNIHKYTQISPNHRPKNQIVHFLIDKLNKSSIIKIKSSRGDQSDTDHILVIATSSIYE